MKIQELFERPIRRNINGVIKADQNDAASVWQELDEYVVTKELDQHFRRFFDSYLAALQRPEEAAGKVGVWISGFFGSGKSQFCCSTSTAKPMRQMVETLCSASS